MATGVLPLYLERLLSSVNTASMPNKGYLARIQLGSATNTLDADGDVVLVKPIPELTEHIIVAVLDPLTGRRCRCLRWYQRSNIEGSRCIDGPARAKKLSGLLAQFKSSVTSLCGLMQARVGSISMSDAPKAHIYGSLAESIGKSLGTVAHLSRLRRDLSGGFSLEQAQPWSAIESLQDNDGYAN